MSFFKHFTRHYQIIRRYGRFAQVKFSDGIMVQPLDNIFLINDEIYKNRVYDKLREIRQGDIVVDVGAHVGVFTLRAARRAKDGLVIAIEPHPLNYRLLVYNVKTNGLKNVIPLNLALTDVDGVATLYLSDISGGHSIKRKSSRYIKVQAKTLDHLLDELGSKTVNFIKIDAEGAEPYILKGAETILRVSKPFLAIAAYHAPSEAKEVAKYLRKRGFKVVFQPKLYVYAFKS